MADYPVNNNQYIVPKPNALGYDSGGFDLMNFLSSIPGIGGIAGLGTSILSGIFGAKDSPHDVAVQEILQRLEREMGYLKSTPYSKGEVEGKVGDIQQTLRGAADIAATKTGTALSESLSAAGVPSGQPKGSIYTAELAPVVAEGEKGAAAAEQWGMQFWASLDDAAKTRLLTALGMEGNIANMQPSMTGGQKGIATFLQTLNLLASGFGNVAQGYKDLTYKPLEG